MYIYIYVYIYIYTRYIISSTASWRNKNCASIWRFLFGHVHLSQLRMAPPFQPPPNYGGNGRSLGFIIYMTHQFQGLEAVYWCIYSVMNKDLWTQRGEKKQKMTKEFFWTTPVCYKNLIPSGKHTKNYGKSPVLTGKSTINGDFQ